MLVHVATLALCAVVLLPASAVARAGASAAPHGPAVLLAQAGERVTLDQAVRMVRERTGGRILRAETRRQNGRAVHRIRVLLDEDRVRTYHVDAETGRIS